MLWDAKNSNYKLNKPDNGHSFLLFPFRTTHLNRRTLGELDALDVTVTVLSCLSIVGDVLKVTLISPCFPGSIWYSGFSTVVQLHSTLASLITKGLLPAFLKINAKCRVSPLCTKPKCWVGLSNLITGCEMPFIAPQKRIAVINNRIILFK